MGAPASDKQAWDPSALDRAAENLQRIKKEVADALEDRLASQAGAELAEAFARHFKRSGERKRYLLDMAARRCRNLEDELFFAKKAYEAEVAKAASKAGQGGDSRGGKGHRDSSRRKRERTASRERRAAEDREHKSSSKRRRHTPSPARCPSPVTGAANGHHATAEQPMDYLPAVDEQEEQLDGDQQQQQQQEDEQQEDRWQAEQERQGEQEQQWQEEEEHYRAPSEDPYVHDPYAEGPYGEEEDYDNGPLTPLSRSRSRSRSQSRSRSRSRSRERSMSRERSVSRSRSRSRSAPALPPGFGQQGGGDGGDWEGREEAQASPHRGRNGSDEDMHSGGSPPRGGGNRGDDDRRHDDRRHDDSNGDRDRGRHRARADRSREKKDGGRGGDDMAVQNEHGGRERSREGRRSARSLSRDRRTALDSSRSGRQRAVAQVGSWQELEVTPQTYTLFRAAVAELDRRKTMPCNVSVLNDIMRTMDPKWHVTRATRGTFSMLCAWFERDGMIRLQRDNATLMIIESCLRPLGMARPPIAAMRQPSPPPRARSSARDSQRGREHPPDSNRLPDNRRMPDSRLPDPRLPDRLPDRLLDRFPERLPDRPPDNRRLSDSRRPGSAADVPLGRDAVHFGERGRDAGRLAERGAAAGAGFGRDAPPGGARYAAAGGGDRGVPPRFVAGVNGVRPDSGPFAPGHLGGGRAGAREHGRQFEEGRQIYGRGQFEERRQFEDRRRFEEPACVDRQRSPGRPRGRRG